MFAYFWEDRVYPFDLFFGSRLLHLLFGSIFGSFFLAFILWSQHGFGESIVFFYFYSLHLVVLNLGIIVLRMF